ANGLRKAVELLPDDAEVHVLLGTGLEQTGDWHAALGQFRQAAKADLISRTHMQTWGSAFVNRVIFQAHCRRCRTVRSLRRRMQTSITNSGSLYAGWADCQRLRPNCNAPYPCSQTMRRPITFWARRSSKRANTRSRQRPSRRLNACTAAVPITRRPSPSTTYSRCAGTRKRES